MIRNKDTSQSDETPLDSISTSNPPTTETRGDDQAK
jgi:hypothetical protein